MIQEPTKPVPPKEPTYHTLYKISDYADEISVVDFNECLCNILPMNYEYNVQKDDCVNCGYCHEMEFNFSIDELLRTNFIALSNFEMDVSKIRLKGKYNKNIVDLKIEIPYRRYFSERDHKLYKAENKKLEKLNKQLKQEYEQKLIEYEEKLVKYNCGYTIYLQNLRSEYFDKLVEIDDQLLNLNIKNDTENNS